MMEKYDRRFCVAPMMGYTTPSARKLYRILSKKTFLFTEMIAAKSLIHSKNKNLIGEIMEQKFDPKAKVKQGQFSDAPDGKQPNREHTNIDFSKHAPKKYQEFEYDQTVTSKPGAEHVQESLFNMADEKDY